MVRQAHHKRLNLPRLKLIATFTICRNVLQENIFLLQHHIKIVEVMALGYEIITPFQAKFKHVELNKTP